MPPKKDTAASKGVATPKKAAPAPQRMNPHVESLDLRTMEPDLSQPELKAAFEAVYPAGSKPADMFPLVPQRLDTVVDGVCLPVGNLIQGSMMGDVAGYCLEFDPHADYTTDDPFLLADMLVRRVRLIPLRFGLTAAETQLQFSLNVRNDTPEHMSVMASDIVPDGAAGAPMFAPTTVLAELGPGCHLEIKNIRVRSGRGRAEACMVVSCKGHAVPLDLPELPRERTHRGLQGDSQRSGFAVPVLESHSRRIRISTTLPCGRGAAARRLPAEACSQILTRLRATQSVIEAGAQGPQSSTRSHWTRFADGDESVLDLHLRGETGSFGSVLEAALDEAHPTCTSVTKLLRHVGELHVQFRLAVPLEDIDGAFLAGVGVARTVFESLRTQFEKIA